MPLRVQKTNPLWANPTKWSNILKQFLERHTTRFSNMESAGAWGRNHTPFPSRTNLPLKTESGSSPLSTYMSFLHIYLSHLVWIFFYLNTNQSQLDQKSLPTSNSFLISEKKKRKFKGNSNLKTKTENKSTNIRHFRQWAGLSAHTRKNKQTYQQTHNLTSHPKQL